MTTTDIKLIRTVPVLPVGDLAEATTFYRDRLGFAVAFEYGKYAGVTRGAVEIHLDGEGGKGGGATCRVNTSNVDGLSDEMTAAGVVDPDEPLRSTPWGTRQFSVLDCAGNRLTFVQDG